MISEVGSPDYIAKSVIFKFCMARGCRDKFHVWNWKPEKRLLVVFKFLVACCGLLCLHVYIGLCFEPLICRCLVCFVVLSPGVSCVLKLSVWYILCLCCVLNLLYAGVCFVCVILEPFIFRILLCLCYVLNLSQ